MAVARSAERQLTALARDLRAAGDKKMVTALRKRLRAAAKPIEAQVKADYRALSSGVKGPSRDKKGRFTARNSTGSRGLRASLARATTTVISITKDGVRIRIAVKGTKMPEAMRGLPYLVEGRKRWRHPLFGDKEHWYAQRSTPVIDKAVDKHIRDVEASVEKAVDDVAKEFERGGRL